MANDLGEEVKNDISGPFRRGYDKLTKYLGNPSKVIPEQKVDTSWHDEMVKQANESFRKRAEEDQKAAQKQVPRKKMPRKR